MTVTRAPVARRISGPTWYAAPFAVSRTTWRPAAATREASARPVLHVAREQAGRVHGPADRSRVHARQLVGAQHERLELVLDVVGELLAAGIEDLEAVVLGRVVGRGDHDPGGEVALPGEVREGRRRHHAHVVDVRAHARRPGGDRRDEHVARSPCVLAHDQRPADADDLVRRRAPERERERGAQVDVRGAADSVRAEQAGHEAPSQAAAGRPRQGVLDGSDEAPVGDAPAVGAGVARCRARARGSGRRDHDGHRLGLDRRHGDARRDHRDDRHLVRADAQVRDVDADDDGRRGELVEVRDGPEQREQHALVAQRVLEVRIAPVEPETRGEGARLGHGLDPHGDGDRAGAGRDDAVRERERHPLHDGRGGPEDRDRRGVHLGQRRQLVGVALDRHRERVDHDRRDPEPGCRRPRDDRVDRQRARLLVRVQRDLDEDGPRLHVHARHDLAVRVDRARLDLAVDVEAVRNRGSRSRARRRPARPRTRRP